MLSPVQRHMQKMRAAKEAEAAQESNTKAGMSTYELMLAQLDDHRRRLKQIQSLTARMQAKAEFLPEYDGYLDGVMESGSNAQDDVFVTLALWHIDAGQYARALDLCAYALEQDMVTPERFERTLACLVAEEFADAALKPDNTVALTQLVVVNDLTEEKDMPDQVRAKLYRATAEKLEATEPQAALNLYDRAIELNPQVGCKPARNKLAKQIDESVADDQGDA